MERSLFIISFGIDLDTTVPAILIYADLMGSGNSRNIEAAQRILEHELQYLQS